MQKENAAVASSFYECENKKGNRKPNKEQMK